jgi:hypothetical protein
MNPFIHRGDLSSLSLFLIGEAVVALILLAIGAK